MFSFSFSKLYNRTREGGHSMITHFQYKPLFENKDMPGWRFSFYYKKRKFQGIYNPDGKIEWTNTIPEDEDILIRNIHEIMLFHEYDK